MIIDVKKLSLPFVKVDENTLKVIGNSAVCFYYDSNELIGKHDILLLRFENKVFEFTNANVVFHYDDMFHYDERLESCYILTCDSFRLRLTGTSEI